MKYWCYYTDVVRYLEKVEALFAPKTRGPAYLVWTDDDGPHMIAGPGIHWYRGDGPMPDLDSLEIPVSINTREGSASAQSTPKKKLRATDPAEWPGPVSKEHRQAPTSDLGQTARQNGLLKIKGLESCSLGAARVSKRLATSAQSTRTRRKTAVTVSKPSPASAQSTRPARQCRTTTWRKPAACRVEPPARHNPKRPSNPAPARKKRRTKGVQLFRNPLKPAHPGKWAGMGRAGMGTEPE